MSNNLFGMLMNLRIRDDVVESQSESTKNFSQNIGEFEPIDTIDNEGSDSDDNFVKIFQNQTYLTQLSELMENISDKGATIAQLKDGAVFVSEVKIMVYKYIWDAKKGVFIKQRTRNTRSNTKHKIDSDVMIDEDIEKVIYGFAE